MAKDLTTSLIDRQNILNLDIVIAFRAIVALVKIQMQLRLVKLVYLSCRFLGSKDGSREHEVGGHGNYDEIDDERKLKR